MLNHGGIRAVIPKGDVTTRTAFEVMPFENSLFIVGLNGKEIKTLAEYIIKEKKPHPLYGMKIYINKSTSAINKIEINNQPLDENRIYYVGTSDYLANGGDNMTFFKDSKIKFDMEYKLRNMMIDFFRDELSSSEQENINVDVTTSNVNFINFAKFFIGIYFLFNQNYKILNKQKQNIPC